MPPLLLPLLAFIAGILASPYLDNRYVWAVAVPALVIGVARPKYAALVVFLIGSGARSHHEVRPPYILDDGFPVRVTAVLEGAPEFRAPGTYLNVRLVTVGEEPWSGRARLSYFPSDGDPSLAALFEQLDLGSGDRIEVLVRLRRPGIYRNPGGFNYRRFLERRGIFWTGSIRSPRLVQVLDRGWHGPGRFRSWATQRITDRRGGDETIVALALGMVFGQRRRLPAATERKFQEAGLIHLLVVSGFNLAIVAAAAVWLGRRLPFGRHQRITGRLCAIAVILGYAFLVEGGTPVVRATLMAVLFIVATLLDRGYAVGNALCAAGILVLFLDPVALEDSGFQLTFAAVLAILLLAVPLIRWGPGTRFAAMRHLDNPRLDTRFPVKLADWRVRQRLRTERTGRPLWLVTLPRMAGLLLAETATVALSVQFTLLPWSIESYHRLSPVALPLNILGAVVATIVTPLGLVLILVPDFIASPVAGIIQWSLAAFVPAIDGALELPGTTFRVPSPPLTLWIGFGILLVAMAWVARRRSRGGLIAGAACSLGLLVLIGAGNFEPRPPAHATLTFLDVGQGDALLVELADGQKIMVDGGGVATGAYRSLNDEGAFAIGEDVLTPYLFSRGIRRLDALVLTHAHYDHIDGLFDLLENFSVGALWLAPGPMVPRFEALLGEASRLGVPIRWLVEGDRVGPFLVLNPPSTRSVGDRVTNDDSLVLLLEVHQSTALLTGDLERHLFDAPSRVTVLKVPHHGSRNTRSRVSADLSVISVGVNNSFGHPHASKLPALRTDVLGAIEIVLTPDGPVVSFPGL